MSVPGPSSRKVYYFDGTANLGVNLTGTDGQVGAFDPPGTDITLQDLSGSASINPVVVPVGHTASPDLTLPIWADSTLQELIDDIHGVTAADRSDQRILATIWTGGDVIGQRVDIGLAYLLSVKPVTPLAELTRLETVWRYTGACQPHAHILHALTARTADGNSQASSIDNAAASSAGGIGYFGYTTYTADGATGLAVRVVDSADNVSFAALVTFTTVTATTGGGSYGALATTATVRRYIASDWDFTGSPGAGTTATFFVAFKRF